MKSRKHIYKTALAAAISITIFPTAFAMPSGANVSDGVVNGVVNGQMVGNTLATSGGAAIINWDAFNIAKNEILNVNTAEGALLNRVTGGSASQLLGVLNQTGKNPMLLINPNGIVVGAGANINAQNLLMSTLQMTDDNFWKMVNGEVSILTREAGYGIWVKNDAHISAKDMLQLYGTSIMVDDNVTLSLGDSRTYIVASRNVHLAEDGSLAGFDSTENTSTTNSVSIKKADILGDNAKLFIGSQCIRLQGVKDREPGGQGETTIAGATLYYDNFRSFGCGRSTEDVILSLASDLSRNCELNAAKTKIEGFNISMGHPRVNTEMEIFAADYMAKNQETDIEQYVGNLGGVKLNINSHQYVAGSSVNWLSGWRDFWLDGNAVSWGYEGTPYDYSYSNDKMKIKGVYLPSEIETNLQLSTCNADDIAALTGKSDAPSELSIDVNRIIAGYTSDFENRYKYTARVSYDANGKIKSEWIKSSGLRPVDFSALLDPVKVSSESGGSTGTSGTTGTSRDTGTNGNIEIGQNTGTGIGGEVQKPDIPGALANKGESGVILDSVNRDLIYNNIQNLIDAHNDSMILDEIYEENFKINRQKKHDAWVEEQGDLAFEKATEISSKWKEEAEEKQAKENEKKLKEEILYDNPAYTCDSTFLYKKPDVDSDYVVEEVHWIGPFHNYKDYVFITENMEVGILGYKVNGDGERWVHVQYDEYKGWIPDGALASSKAEAEYSTMMLGSIDSENKLLAELSVLNAIQIFRMIPGWEDYNPPENFTNVDDFLSSLKDFWQKEYNSKDISQSIIESAVKKLTRKGLGTLGNATIDGALEGAEMVSAMMSLCTAIKSF